MAFHIPATESTSTSQRYLYSTLDMALTEDSDRDTYRDTLLERHLRPQAGQRLTRFEFRACSRAVSDELECIGRTGKHLGLLYYHACIRAMHDVMVDGKYGTSQRHDVVPVDVRAEIGMYARKLCTEVAPDFFGLSQLTSVDAGDGSAPGVTTATDSKSPAESGSE